MLPSRPWTDGQLHTNNGVRYKYVAAAQRWTIDTFVATGIPPGISDRLGTTGLLVADWNTANEAGFYHATAGVANGPPGSATLAQYGNVSVLDASTATRIAFVTDPVAGTTRRYRSDKVSGIWGAWYDDTAVSYLGAPDSFGALIEDPVVDTYTLCLSSPYAGSFAKLYGQIAVGTATVQVTKNGSPVGAPLAVSSAVSNVSLGNVALAIGDVIGLTVSAAASNGAKLSVSANITRN